nr:LysR family transcriptional regulator [Biostraticola tofi]
MSITLRQMEIFAEIVKSGSTSRATALLGLSQSAVSA